MGTLGNWTTLDENILARLWDVPKSTSYLFVDVLQRSVGMLAVAHSVSSHTGLAGIFLAFDQHLGEEEWVVGGARREVTVGHGGVEIVKIDGI